MMLAVAACPAAALQLHIVAFGDSATSGYLIPHQQAYPAQLQQALRSKGHDVTVKNAGIAGDTTAGALKRFDEAIDPGTDICILEFGANDLRRGSSMTGVRARIADLIRALQARRIDVLVIGLGRLDLTGVARENGVPYAQWQLPTGKFRARDGAHFNAEGYRILIGRMLPQIESLLAARQTK